MASLSYIQPLFCHIPAWQQQQQQQVAYYNSAAAASCGTAISPQQQQQQQQQYFTSVCGSSAGRPCDLGYESDRDCHYQQTLQHCQPQRQPQAQPQPQPQVLPQVQPQTQPQPLLLKAASPSGSSCDSARPESPADAQLAEVTHDLAGFSLSGPRPVDMALSQKMEIVWHQRFSDFFSRFPVDTWHLMPVFDEPDIGNTSIAKEQWRCFRDQAKVRFICTSCQKAWTSMAGQVVFWIYKDSLRNTGYVHFKLYGQKCSHCCPEYYEHAIWYQEEVEKVIENLYYRVGQLFYGQQQQRKRVDRRPGQPKKEHNTGTCQACQENVCRMGQVLRKKMRTEA